MILLLLGMLLFFLTVAGLCTIRERRFSYPLLLALAVASIALTAVGVWQLARANQVALTQLRDHKISAPSVP